MLQTMRENAQGWIAKVVVAVIAFTFAIFGLESLAPNPGNPTVASVNGDDITEQQLYQAMEQQRRMMQQRFGANFDPSSLDEAMLRQAALDQLITRTLLTQSITDAGLEVSQESLDDQIRNTPVFQNNGQFDPDRFQAMVRGAGMTPLQYRAALREDQLVNQQMSGISGSEFVTQTELNTLLSLQNQKRDIAWLTLNFDKAQAAIEVSEEDARQYYDARKEQFMTPETVSVSYIELNREALRDQVDIDENDVEQRYQAMVAELEAERLPQAAIVLVETNDNRDESAAKARADEAYAKLQAGDDFAAVAMEFSDDTASSTEGGNIGAVEEGFFGAAFDEALSALKPGEFSQPVKTEFGYQIIRLNGYESQNIPAYDDVRDELVQEIQDSELAGLFVEKSQKLADISFEAADLQQPAEELGLTIQKTDLFGRNGGAEGIIANQKVVDAAFSDDVLSLGANSEIIELDPDHIIVLRTREHNQPEQRTFEDVRDTIFDLQRRDIAGDALQQQAEKLQLALEKGESRDAIAAEAGAEWAALNGAERFGNDAPQQVLQEAFRLPHPQQNGASYAVVELPSSDVALVALTNVTAGEVDADQADNTRLARILAVGEGRNLYSELLRDLRAEATIKMK
ncbi:SurA N-terminal domain-containing protein [Endozoicomonadaceae bacterium StTr2]